MSENSGLLLDTQVLVWIGRDDRRLSAAFRSTLMVATTRYFVSAVVAYEFEDLRLRNRFPEVDNVNVLIRGLGAEVLDYPAAAHRIVPLLPDIHRDPVDRMLIAHAIHADLTVVTADAKMREYPVRSLW